MLFAVFGGCADVPEEFAGEASGTAMSGTAADSSEGSGAIPDPLPDSTAGPTAMPMCGDGTVTADEDCDDGNDSQIDGCTSTCRLGPTAMALLEPSFQTDMVGGWEDQGIIGGIDACPAGQVLQGFAGTLDALSSASPPTTVIGQIAGLCGTVSLVDDDPTAITTADGTMLPPHGESGDESWRMRCPEGQAVSGLSGQAGQLLDQLEIACRAFQVDGMGDAQSISLTPAPGKNPVGGEGGDDFGPTSCPEGQIAGGVATSVTSQVIRLGLHCWTPTLVYP